MIVRRVCRELVQSSCSSPRGEPGVSPAEWDFYEKGTLLVNSEKLKGYTAAGKCIHFKSVPEGNGFTHQLPIGSCHLFPSKGRLPKMFIF